MFSTSNFIYSYAPTDRAIRIIDTSGNIVHTINICNYQKSGVFGANLAISMEDQFDEYLLSFPSNSEAKVALNMFKNTINTLKPNCVSNFNSGPAPVPGTTVSITYVAFKALQVANNLVPLQWYDISDTTNILFNNGNKIIRVLVQETDDRHNRGQIIGSHEYVVFDCVLDKITYYNDSVKNITIVNGTPNNHSFTNSDNIFSSNSSAINADASFKIEASNSSNLTCSSCMGIKATNFCNLTLSNASNVTFNNIQQNMSSFPFTLSNLEIDRNNSLGKHGFTNRNNPSGTILLNAYGDQIEQDITFTTNNNTVIFNLSNLITQAKSIFRIRYKGNGINNTITVANNNLPIIVIMDNNKDNTLEFSYNSALGIYELRNIETKVSLNGKSVQLTGLATGQINFNLNIPITAPEKTELFINGIKQLYSLDFFYNSTLGLFQYLNRFYIINSNDELEFIVY